MSQLEVVTCAVTVYLRATFYTNMAAYGNNFDEFSSNHGKFFLAAVLCKIFKFGHFVISKANDSHAI